jgi:hypothetical protein
MNNYLRDARFHAEKIEHYHAHAGAAGYSQATHHQLQLNELLGRAHRSKRGPNDVPAIQAIIQAVRSKMDEMRKRQNESNETPGL